MFRDETFQSAERAGTVDQAVDLVMDEETFRAFYERTAAPVWAYLARLTGDRHAADDLLQETFYRFLRAGTAHDNELHRRNSLYRIATNLARDAHRRKMLRPLVGFANDEIDRMAFEHKPERANNATDVSRAMARLKPQERAMLWLAYAEGASHPEIARALGLKPGSMKMLLFRARRKMAALLKGEDA
jgi:RNA polymerase sigma-70 factor (ECF subfamily)